MTEHVFRRYNIDRKQFHLFLADREDDTQSLRLGQHFIVTFVPGLHWPELFYEENPNVSTIMCLDFIDKYNSVMNNETIFTTKQELKIKRLEQDHRELKKEVAALRKIIVEIRQNKQPEDDTND